MHRPWFRILILLALLAVSAGVSSKEVTAAPLCFIVGQECVACGPDLQKKCTYYVCTDGSERTGCGQCSLFCFVA